MRVKVCSITNIDDALAASDMGAWALGFNFYQKSPRYILPSVAATIIKQLPENITTVGIFVNEQLDVIKSVQNETGIKMIQLHGDESLEFCMKINKPIIKAFRPTKKEDIQEIEKYSNFCSILIDANFGPHYGGTGQCADWEISKKMAMTIPIILAGGLNVENVQNAIVTVKPSAVDVCSGVEIAPGYKSHKKLKDFFSAITL